MKKIVFDSYAVLAWMKGERSSAVVVDYLSQASEKMAEVFMCSVNAGEVFYIVQRTAGVEKAKVAIEHLRRTPIKFVPADLEVCLLAAALKGTRRIAYVDCLAAAVARIKNCPILTGDREFSQLESEVRVKWL